MSSIWAENEGTWKLLAPVGFPDEATLHRLVEEAPHLLPLSGSPALIVLGREVPLGGGYADVLAVEPSGRLALVEVKLARNAEARRAVVAQILAYAAYLRGTSTETLERETLRSQLRERGYETIASLVASQDAEGSFDEAEFASKLAGSLSGGRFRLVLVLDDAPAELVRLVGYLESIAPELAIDLVALRAYDINGRRALVPQRIEPERQAVSVQPAQAAEPRRPKPYRIPPEEFEESISHAPEPARPPLKRMYQWARSLEQEGALRLLAIRGTSGRTTLLPYLLNEDAGLITIWNDNGFYLSPWRSVFERRAARSSARVEAALAPQRLGSGNSIRDINDELLDALAAAYREAAGLASI